MLERFEQIGSQAVAELEQVRDLKALEDFRIKYLGRKGLIMQLLSEVGRLPREEKPRGGQLANQAKNEVTAAFEARKKVLEDSQKQTRELIDVTLPGLPAPIGKPHVITQTINELLDIFGRMGFGVAYGPEVEDEWHNFIALNIPPEHPARDPLDNFYIEDNILLRSQTSTIQIRVMETRKHPTWNCSVRSCPSSKRSSNRAQSREHIPSYAGPGLPAPRQRERVREISRYACGRLNSAGVGDGSKHTCLA